MKSLSSWCVVFHLRSRINKWPISKVSRRRETTHLSLPHLTLTRNFQLITLWLQPQGYSSKPVVAYSSNSKSLLSGGIRLSSGTMVEAIRTRKLLIQSTHQAFSRAWGRARSLHQWRTGLVDLGLSQKRTMLKLYIQELRVSHKFSQGWRLKVVTLLQELLIPLWINKILTLL
jgi:hypothetical protein